MAYLGIPDYDPMTRHAWQFVNSGSYGGVTYGKTATVLTTLEALIGEDAMRRSLHEYFMRYRFKHPNGPEFLQTIKDVTGRQDLDDYFSQAVTGTRILDYEVTSVDSEPAKWWDPPSGRDECSKGCQDTVTLHRKGDFILPVTLEVKFSDGTKKREHWDGQDRWTRFTYLTNAKIISAEVDPDHQIWLDKDFFNNSFVVEHDGTATHKWANYWLFANQLIAQMLTWLV
jgi:hypothetical protein